MLVDHADHQRRTRGLGASALQRLGLQWIAQRQRHGQRLHALLHRSQGLGLHPGGAEAQRPGLGIGRRQIDALGLGPSRGVVAGAQLQQQGQGSARLIGVTQGRMAAEAGGEGPFQIGVAQGLGGA